MELISRKEAKEKGLTRYFTGAPCKHGHISERSVSNHGCTECIRILRVKSYQKDIEKSRRISRERARTPKVKAQNKAYKKTQKYKDQQRKYAKEKANYEVSRQNFEIPEHIKGTERKSAYANAYYHHNKEKIKLKSQSEERRSKRKEYINKWSAQFRKTKDGKACGFMRKCIYRCLIVKNKNRTEEILGYKKNDLKARIEYQFKDGMSWDNYGDWHIDHKKPISRFLAQGITDPKIINALSNLQPLWSHENLSKGSSYNVN